MPVVPRRSIRIGLPCAMTVAVAIGLFVPRGLALAQLPLEPIGRSGESVTPAFEGWYQNSDGSYSLLLGYYNRNSVEALDIPVGPGNRIEPGGPDFGQPTHFLPRRQWGVFTITVPRDFGKKTLTWTIVSHGRTNSIPIAISNPVYVIEPLRDAAMGNTPPVLRFEPNGKVFTGPPVGKAIALNTSISSPLALTVWVGHQPGWKPELAGAAGAGAPSGPDLTLTWSKHRGAGEVKFDNSKPAIGKPDGKATATATFSAPGDYVLRGQVNDHTGEGGGGFQCCWTNVLVDVSVKPGSSAR
jgi:hypothetical protein